MSKLTELLTKRDKLQSDLERARVNAPDVLIQRDLEALQAEIDRAAQGESRRELATAQAELVKLERDARAFLGRLVTFGREIQPDYDGLLVRYLAAKTAARRWPDDFTTMNISPTMNFVTSIAASLAEFVKNSDRLSK